MAGTKCIFVYIQANYRKVNCVTVKPKNEEPNRTQEFFQNLSYPEDTSLGFYILL